MKAIALPAFVSLTLFVLCTAAEAADKPAALKEAFKGHFLVGTAINRNMATGAAGPAGAPSRTRKTLLLSKSSSTRSLPKTISSGSSFTRAKARTATTSGRPMPS